jgi:hypothetical protein
MPSTDRRFYGVILVVLLAVELLIARYLHDRFVRPYVGDAIAVVLAYAGFRALFGLGFRAALLAALLLATAIEIGQAFHLTSLLGLAGYPAVRVVLGHGFDWLDFAAYGLGGLAVVIGEKGPNRTSERSL